MSELVLLDTKEGGEATALVDLFCGAGGSGGGLLDACEILDERVNGTFVNHWDRAIEIHEANHPEHRHLEEDLFKLAPEEVFPPGTDCSLLWASPQCFTEDALVLTSRGMVSIAKVETGDLVLTHKGRWKPVVAAMHKVADTIRLQGHGHQGLETTAEHPFYSKRVTKRHPKKNADGKRSGYKRELVENPYWPKAEDMEGKLWAMPIKVEALPIPMDHGMMPDSGLFYVIGRWLGDGSISKGDVVISAGKHEVESAKEKLESSLKDARGEYRPWRYSEGVTADTLSYGSVALSRFLLQEFQAGAHNKRLPGWCFSLPDVWRDALISGYLDADGHSCADRRSSISSVSGALAHSMKILLAQQGHSVTHLHQDNDRGCIDGRPIKGSKIHSVTWKPGNTRQTRFTDSRHAYQTCKKVSQCRKDRIVYNLQVADDESYVVDGIVVHNCTFFSIARGATCINEQDRSHAHSVTDWIKHLNPEGIQMENVKEFVNWGPTMQKRQPDFITKGKKRVKNPDKGELMWALNAQPVRLLPRRLKRKKRTETEDQWSERMVGEGYTPYEVPDPDRKGEYFDAWIQEVKDLGYDVEHRLLRSCNYGDPTIRLRLFIYCVRKDSSKRIVWPEATHAEMKDGVTPEGFWRWRTARDIIDWDLKGTSVFTRKRKLADNTFRRLAIGLVKYGLESYLVSSAHGSVDNQDRRVHSTDEPVKTLTSKGERGVVQPDVEEVNKGEFLSPNFGERPGQTPRTHDVDKPLPTVTSHGAGGVIKPSIVELKGCSTARSVDEPLSTSTSQKHQALSEPEIEEVDTESYILPKDQGWDKKHVRPVDKPVSALTTNHRGEMVVSPLIDNIRGTGVAKTVDNPLVGMTAGGRNHALAEAFMMAIDQTGGGRNHGCYPVDQPVRTLVTKNNASCIELNLEEVSDNFLQACDAKGVDASRAITFLNFLVEELHKRGRLDAKPWIYVYYSNGSEGMSIDRPLPSCRTKAGHALVYPVIELDGKLLKVDLFYRMLTTLELQRAMGLPDDMDWATATQTETVKAIGNSVSRGVARALGLAFFSQNSNIRPYVEHIYGGQE